MLDHIDRAILRYLFRHNGWASTNRIAERVGISWLTSKKHLNELNRTGYVVRGHTGPRRRRGRKTYWRINE